MIVVRVEMWPGGDHTRKRTLSEAVIYNIGGTRSKGEYAYKISKVGGFKCDASRMATGDVPNELRHGRIAGFPRLRLYAFDLLLRCLFQAFGMRNGLA